MASKYEKDEDGFPREIVGVWSKRKLKILTNYIQASSATRKKFLRSEATYIDVFCGPGRCRIRDTAERIHGSPVAAFNQATQSGAPFSCLHVSDFKPKMVNAAEARLLRLGAPVRRDDGDAAAAIERIVERCNPSGLHLAFLDPYNLGTLSFSIFKALARLKRVDVIVHVSVQDLQRNTRRYTTKEYDQFDEFAPGWRNVMDPNRPQAAVRLDIVKYWSEKVASLGLPRANHEELITGEKNERLYWLFFLASNEFAQSLWPKISSAAKAPTLFD
jgi:three-Cys-motif partner protein